MKRIITCLLLFTFLLVSPMSLAMGSALKNHPKLILSDYTLSQKHPVAGEEFALTMSFYNTNEEYSARNIKITLSSSALDSNPGSYGIFTPVGSSNTFYFDIIEAQESAEKTVHFSISPGAPSNTYSLFIEIQYENYQGVQLEARETIGIPVMQTPRIMIDDPNVPSEIKTDEGLNLSVGIYNIGRDDLKNVMIEAAGNFTADPARYFIGDFSSGKSDIFSSLLKSEGTGDLNGVVKVTFEDSTGMEHKLEKPFRSYVLPAEADETPDAASKPVSRYHMLSALLLAILIVSVFLRMRREKRARKMRDELKIDE